MRQNKILCITLILLIIGANFVSRCHASSPHAGSIHFIIEPCASHECNRASESQSCSEESCNHELCADQSIISAFRTSQFNHMVYIAPPLQPVPFVPALVIYHIEPLSAVDVPALAPDRTTVLRI
jgi:hypothetical protein